ncbi:hypothetical protein ACFE04_005491 [Oxalis oulophora]
MATRLLSVYCFFILLIIFFSSPAASQEVEDETGFDYSPTSGRGPEQWGTLNASWSACGNGMSQSPIDLPSQNVAIENRFIRLMKNYIPANSTLENRGHDIKLRWIGGGGSIVLNGTLYILQQIHWHTPSEHTIKGQRFALEAHMVHESIDGLNIAVIGILYKIGSPDSFIASLEGKLAAVTDTTGAEEDVGVTNPNDIRMESLKYFTYNGSLTVPPCTENVLWTIPTKIRTVTRNQVNLLRVAVHDESNTNARPLQPLNNRTVTLFLGS